MNNNEMVKFANIMAILVIATDKEPSKERTALYFDYLKDLEINDIANAVNYIIKTETYPTFPTIGKIRSLIEGEVEDKIEGEALAAWARACKLAWDHGDTGEPTGDKMLDEAVRVAFGGWKDFGERDPSFDMADRKHFLSCYRSVARRDKIGMLDRGEIEKLGPKKG